jgi:RHH-type proline utilization regulon transcriptional repressor/proline dehydrogenase/delta 1-pyrroline-5-carboxylate dehydrogenase
VIDAEAQHALLAHIDKMRASGHTVFQLPLPPVCANGTFVPPTLIEIGNIGELEREVFGPVLHVVRFARGQLDELVRRINATGYGLTLGIHTRIDETIDFIAAHANVGNIYVNRSMIGAVVGVQPFGGEGKSGTGPKAGGPLYLHRLLRRAPLSFSRIGGEHLPDEQGEQGALAPLQALADWAQQTGRRMLAELCTEYAMSTPLRYRVPLPGPTGESNTLVFAPRGLIACIADDEATLLEQIAAVLATGNRALLAGGPVSRVLVGMLPTALSRQLRIEPDWIHALLAVALYAGPVENAHLLRNELAARDGARVPLITARGKDFPLYRLMAERVVSVNTTAAGGNASLMTLGI